MSDVSPTHPLQRIDLTFPARDERLCTLVPRLSGPNSGPHADNLVSNEDSYPRVAGELARRVRPGGVYVGVGPDQNFTLMAHSRPSLAFVVDYRRRNLVLQLLHRALFSLAADRAAYLTLLTARDPGRLPADVSSKELVAAFTRAEFDRDRLAAATAEVERVLRPLDLLRENEWADLATIQARLAGPGMSVRFLALPMYPTFGRLVTTTDRHGGPAHVLASEPLYQSVRSRQLSDCVIPLVINFAAPGAFDRLGTWLRDRGLTVGVMYVSDVEFFLLRAGTFARYVANLGHLPWSDGAVIVRTSTREIDHPERFRGDSSTTVVRDAAAFLTAAQSGAIRTPNDLFDSRLP